MEYVEYNSNIISYRGVREANMFLFNGLKQCPDHRTHMFSVCFHTANLERNMTQRKLSPDYF